MCFGAQLLQHLLVSGDLPLPLSDTEMLEVLVVLSVACSAGVFYGPTSAQLFLAVSIFDFESR